MAERPDALHELHEELRQETAAAEPSCTTAAQALELNSKELVDQIYDSIVTLCNDGFDEVNCGLRNLQVCEGSLEGPQHTPTLEVLAMLWQGMEQLRREHHAKINEQMAKFEAHALQTCLRIPPGLMALQPMQQTTNMVESGNEQQLEELQSQLANLWKEIATVNQEARKIQEEIKAYDKALKKYGNLSQLQDVAGVLAGKENAAEDAAIMVAKGSALLIDCKGLEMLGEKLENRLVAPVKDALEAEKLLPQLHPAAQGISLHELQGFQELLFKQ